MTEPICRSPLLVSASESVLLIVDAQTKLLSLMPNQVTLVWNLKRLAEAATILDVPKLATEQYPEKLGATDPSLAALLKDNPWQANVPDKLTFSCAGCVELVAALQRSGRRQVVIGGLETHVCVLQTAFDLTTAGFDVALAVDALGARYALDHATAIRRMEAAGMTLTTTEGVLFEWCERAGTPEFKQVSQLVRQAPPEANTSASYERPQVQQSPAPRQRDAQ